MDNSITIDPPGGRIYCPQCEGDNIHAGDDYWDQFWTEGYIYVECTCEDCDTEFTVYLSATDMSWYTEDDDA